MEHELYDFFYHAEDRHWWFRARRRILASVLEATFPEGGLRIADVGCGTGGMLPMLARFGEVTGVDEAPEAREYCARRGFPGVLAPEAWHETGQRYDLVTAFDVAEHVEDDVAFLRRLAGHVRPGGHVLLTVPAYPFLWSFFDEMNHHQRRYTRSSLHRSLDAAGIRVERMTHFNFLLLPPVILERIREKLRGFPPPDNPARRAAVEKWFRVGPLNRILEAVFASERAWLRRWNLPAGSSILALGRVESA